MRSATPGTVWSERNWPVTSFRVKWARTHNFMVVWEKDRTVLSAESGCQEGGLLFVPV
jgi:hypothetical protein